MIKADKQYHKFANPTIYGLIFIFILASGFKQIKRRETGHWDRREITKNNFIDSKQYLDSIGINPDAKILVIDAYTTNAPLILMDRKGYTVLTTSEKRIKQALDWNYDYIVIQDEFLITDVIKGYPEIINHIQKINGNGKISVYKKIDLLSKNPITLQSFLGFENKLPVFTSNLEFDSIPDKYWSKIYTQNIDSTGNLYGYVNKEYEFGITFSLKDSLIFTDRNHTMLISGDFNLIGEKNNCKLVSSLTIGKNLCMYKSFDLNQLVSNPANWSETTTLVPIPKIKFNSYELKVYIWNPGGEKCYFDNIRIKIY